MRALVTGIAGFVGSSIAHRLLSEGWEVVGVDSLTDYYDPQLKRQNLDRISNTRAGQKLEIHIEDLVNCDIEAKLEGVDAVFHQAGQPGVRKSWGADFANYTHSNISATQRLLEAALRVGTVGRLVYASSSSVYGDAETYPTAETLRPEPRSPYGVTKLAAEHLCSLYAKNYKLPTVSLRYFTVYGPRQRPDMAFTRFLRAAVTDQPLSLYGDGEQIRDFTFIDDIVDANVRAATLPLEAGAVLNVCGGSSVSVNEVLQEISSITGRSLKINRLPAVSGDVRRTGGTSDEIQEKLGWQARVSVAEGLRSQYEWVKSTR